MFNVFKSAVQKQFNHLKQHDLFRVQVDKDLLWSTYLNSFPEGTNPIYKERTEHDCQCCKQFIRAVGNMVAIVNGKVESIWDVQVGGFYQVVADALSAAVKASAIENIFIHNEIFVGTDKNYQLLESGKTLTWEHFSIQLPRELVARGEELGTKMAEARTAKEMLFQGLTEITLESADTVLELIAQNSIYRGEEHRFAVETFRRLKKKFGELATVAEKDLLCWEQNKSLPQSVSRIRTTVIGSLLIDLSKGKDLEVAVASFEAKVAPTNYKRPTSLITKSMIEQAQQKIAELGLTAALERRYARIEDITINNVLFADSQAKKVMGDVFDELASQAPEKAKNLDRVEEVSIDAFIKNILPTAKSLELMFENRHASNLVSLIAPSDLTAKGMFKWGNNFSWSYAGELTDSIKERVKNAGGKVDGDLRCSLSWFNHDDLDLHMLEPGGYHISYRNKRVASPNGGVLDVDMNAGGGTTRQPVENICYENRKRMKEGVYKLQVHNFCRREAVDTGFEVEIEFDGVIHTFRYAKPVRDGEYITVAEVKYSHKNGFKIINSLPSSQAVKQVWGIPTQTFHKVKVAMLSPNHWDEKAVGNKHYFFMLEGCVNDGRARGFFNEFLTEDLAPHRKVFEVVGSKMKVEESNNQLSGLGFSSTQGNSVLCRVKGSFTRTIKINF